MPLSGSSSLHEFSGRDGAVSPSRPPVNALPVLNLHALDVVGLAVTAEKWLAASSNWAMNEATEADSS
jgi:hypothetical protein